MTVTSTSHIKRKVIALTVILFVLGYVLILKAGISDVRHLFSNLVASYLLAWGAYALASRIPRDEIRSQFILMTLSLGFALTLAEAPTWLELIDYRHTFSTSGGLPWEKPGYIPDRELLARPKPYYSVRIGFTRGNIGEFLCLPHYPADSFDLRYDRNGFRNETDLTRADIAVLGDSYVESPMIPGPMLMTSRLAELQSKTVANLGQSGFGVQQELAVLKRYALPLHPKSIIWLFYEGNDLVDTRQYEEKAALLVTMWNSVNTLWDRSFTRNAMLGLMRRVQGCVPHPNLNENFGTVSDTEGREYRLYFLDHTISSSPTAQELDALQQAVSAMKTAYELTRGQGVQFVVVFAPTTFRVYHDIATFTEASGDIRWWVVNDLPDRLRSMVSQISPDIDYLDLTPALKSAAKKGTLVFLSDDTHWTSEGHRVVAQALHGALTTRTQTYVEKQHGEQFTNQAALDVTSNVIMVRNQDGAIRYWSKGAQELYGWQPQEALGKRSHRLLKTVFPEPLENIEAELLAKGYWEGQLVHKRRDGSKVMVASRWELQQDARAKDQSITVIEINSKSTS